VSIPIVVDGSTLRIEGELWRAGKPAIWPWFFVWLVSLAAALAVARLAPRAARRGIVYVACASCALLVLFVSAGFARASARTGLTRWLDLAFPVAIAAGAVTVFLLRSRHRQAAAAIVGGFAFAAALEDVAVLRHGFIVSTLPAAIVRAGVALALAAGALALVVSLVEFWRGEPEEGRRPSPRPQRQMAIPRGKAG
jgi:cell division protein FtsW (lipid II flippase)